MKGARGSHYKRSIVEEESTVTKASSPRQSKRIKSQPSIPPASTNSKDFDHDSTSSQGDSELHADNSSFDAQDTVAESSSHDASLDPEDSDFDAPATQKLRQTKGRQPNGRTSSTGKELWRTGVKSNLEPGKEVFIKLPQARGAGKVLYKDETLHPNTLLFLDDLRRNNDRQWLKFHDPDYRQSQKDFHCFIEKLTERLVDKDETLPELPTKDIVFRIYRDVRFSKDQTPYKTYFSAAWSRTGRKGPYAAYYIQVAPGTSFVGGGLWQPEAPSLNLLRKAVDTKSHKLKRVLSLPGIRRKFLGGTPEDESKVVKSFVRHNSGNALKRKPKGYDDDNPNLDLLRLKNYTMSRKLSDNEILSPDSLEVVLGMLATLSPFIRYLNSVVMPDAEEDSTGDGDSESDGGSNS